MGLPKNKLDDKQMKDFVEEALAKLPSLSPKWTDYNITDPGITILELIAWLQDINIYKLSHITEKHILKYLQLLSCMPEPVRPSKTILVLSSELDEIIEIPKGTCLKAQFHGSTIGFLTTGSVYVQKASIKKLIISNERGTGEYLLDRKSEIPDFFYIFGEEDKRNNLFYIGFDRPLKETFNLGVKLFEDDLPERGKHGSERLIYRPDVEIEWSYWTENGWKVIEPEVDGTDKFYRSGVITFSLKGLSQMKEKSIPVNSEKALFFLRCRLKDGEYELSPRVKRFYINAVEVIQKERISETVGVSNGFPSQEFHLKRKPITTDRVEVKVNNEIWEETEDLKYHSNRERVFTVDRNEGKIKFGDKINGNIPPYGSTISVIYFISSGKKGNISENVSWETGIDGIKAQNPFRAEGGSDPESLEEAFIRAKKDLKEPYQCVTEKDFEYIAINTPDLRVARAKAYKGEGKNTVNIIVVPFSLKKRPYPSENFIRSVCYHLDRHRLITTNVKVKTPEYAEISTVSKIRIKEGFSPELVVKRAEKKLRDFFHPIFGWKDGRGWIFGYPVYLSDIYECLEKVDGVDCVFNLKILPKGAFLKVENGNVILKPFALTVSGVHRISIVESVEECRGMV